jgi:hypothetical protein
MGVKTGRMNLKNSKFVSCSSSYYPHNSTAVLTYFPLIL